ncbi:hypothetical protein [Fundicoccus culcitae]|uniref:Uncharacterized protein n=1 Tax=Fundicoccus culcitae TaxID=2969821 RepID=A0ABY5P3Z2_9LACT|nr:hypothetical protein [Fundicoccus culcitae]UUX33457.1 hypothetical protein NRE15_11185 [Fundicoccus culcitae]
MVVNEEMADVDSPGRPSTVNAGHPTTTTSGKLGNKQKIAEAQ